MGNCERVRGQGTGRALAFLVVPAIDVLRPNGKQAVEKVEWAETVESSTSWPGDLAIGGRSFWLPLDYSRRGTSQLPYFSS